MSQQNALKLAMEKQKSANETLKVLSRKLQVGACIACCLSRTEITTSTLHCCDSWIRFGSRMVTTLHTQHAMQEERDELRRNGGAACGKENAAPVVEACGEDAVPQHLD